MSSSSSTNTGNANPKLRSYEEQKKLVMLLKDFESAKSTNKMLKAFQKLEKQYHKLEKGENLLGLASWKLAQQLSEEGEDPENVLCFGKRALKTLIDLDTNEFMIIDIITNKSLAIAELLTLLGDACYKLSRFDESLSYLNWANRNLCKLEPDDEEVLGALVATQVHLYRVKFDMGRTEELVVHARKILEVKEKILDEDRMELGKAYWVVSDSYILVENYEEALPFCLKSVEIQAKHLGQDSVELAQLRRDLGIIYSALEDFDKAIEQIQLAHRVLKGEKACADFLMSNSDMLMMRLGRYGEALAVLKGVVSNAAGNQSQLAMVYVFMAKAFAGLEKFDDAENHIKLALRLFDKKGMDPGTVITGLWRVACLYEEMKDFKTAISMLLRLLTAAGIPQEILREFSTRHAELIRRKKKAVEGQGPSEVDKLDEAFALLTLMKEKIGGSVENSPKKASRTPIYDEDFSAKNT